MKIKVISDITSRQQRKRIDNQFTATGTEFEFFDAVTPDNSLHHIAGYDESEFVLNCGRLAHETEIARYASHLALWHQCAQEGVPYLVLEDDAELTEAFLTGLLLATSQIEVLGFIHLAAPEEPASVLMRQFGPFEIRFCRHAPHSARGYAISPHAADLLIQHGDRVQEPVDSFLQRFWHHRQPVFTISPPVLNSSNQVSDKVFTPQTRPKNGFRLWIRRMARKVHASRARHWFSSAFLNRPSRFLDTPDRAKAHANIRVRAKASSGPQRGSRQDRPSLDGRLNRMINVCSGAD